MAATESGFVYDESYKANADLSSSQFFAVKQDTAEDNIVLAAASTDHILGILQNNPTSGHAADVRLLGRSKAVVGGTVAVGDYLTANSAGKLITTTTDKDFIVAQAMSAGSSGDTISVLMRGFLASF